MGKVLQFPTRKPPQAQRRALLLLDLQAVKALAQHGRLTLQELDTIISRMRPEMAQEGVAFEIREVTFHTTSAGHLEGPQDTKDRLNVVCVTETNLLKPKRPE